MDLPAELQHQDAHVQDAISTIYNRQHLHGQTSAKRAAQSLVEYTQILVAKNASNPTIFDQLEQARELLIQADTRHARIKNTLRFMLDHDFYLIEEGADLIAYLQYKYKQIIVHFQQAHDTAVELGVQKLRSGTSVFVYGFSSEIIEVIQEFIHQGHELAIWTAEARPLFSGRQIAEELSKANIEVNFVADSHIRYAIKQCKMCFISGEAIDRNEKIHAVMGSELVCDIAEKYHIPVYCFLDGWQYDPDKSRLENKDKHIISETIWNTVPAHTTVIGLAYEKIEGAQIAGIISELGITTSEEFIDSLHNHFSDLF